MNESVQEIAMAEIATVGKGLTGPQYVLSIQENDHESRGGHFRITNATRERAVKWLRSAADAIEQGRALAIENFA
jgi:hypothetical protein